MVLVPECVAAVKIPVIAAGGIATGAQMAAALALKDLGMKTTKYEEICGKGTKQILFSQVDIHVEYGGVVPELASRDHIRKTLPLVRWPSWINHNWYCCSGLSWGSLSTMRVPYRPSALI